MIEQGYWSKDVAEFLCLLSQHRVRYLIVGGEAVIFYGHARLTGDIDIFYQRGDRNSKRLFDALQKFWHGKIPDVRTTEDLMQEGTIIQFGIPPNRIDLINSIDGVEFNTAWKRKLKTPLSHNGRRFLANYIGLDDLIKNKKAIARDKDMDDLKFLNEMRKRFRSKRGVSNRKRG